MEYAKCEDKMSEGTASCPDCGAKAGQNGQESEVPLYQADVKTLLKTGKLAVYRDRTEFVTSNVQKVVFTYTGLVAVRKDLGSGIDFITEDGHTETCPADRKCVYEALVHIRQAIRPYLAQRKERLLSQGVQYSFPSSQGFLNDGVLDLSDKQALFKARSGQNDTILYEKVKSVSAPGGNLDFQLFGGAVKSFAVSKELRDEVLTFVTDSIAPYLARRKEALLAQGIYFSSIDPDGGALDIRADRIEYRARSGQAVNRVSFQDVRTASVYGEMLELAMTNGASRSFPIEADIAADTLDFIKKAIEPYVAARTVGFDTAFGLCDRVEFNGGRGVYHFIRQDGREITGEWPMDSLISCKWAEDKKLTALGSVVSSGIALIKGAAKPTGGQADTVEKIGSVDVILTVHIGQDMHSESVCFGRSSVGMSRTDKKYTECLSEWDRLAEYLSAHCPQCALIAPVRPAVPEDSTPPKQTWSGDTDSLRATGVKETPADTTQLSGLDEFIENVSNYIGNDTTVRSIAFLGNRGIGRNSVLGMLFERMEDQYNNGRLFWFNVRQLPTDVSGESLTILMGKTLVKLLSGSGAAAKQAGNILSGLAGLTTGIIVGDTALGKDVAGNVLCKNGTDIKAESAMNLFGRIEKKARSKNGKVIFFLDGLEQLAPARAVEMLEAMQGYFDCKGCMFVISADHAAILRGARERYDGDKAERFFDRVFERTVKVPASGFHTEGYVKDKLEKMGIQVEDGAELDLYSALIQHSIGRDTEIMDRLFTSAQLLKDLSGEAVYADRYKRQMLFALLCMQMRFRDIYDYAMQQRDSVTPELLASLCGKSAQPWMAAQTENEMAAYRDFGGVLAQIISPEISEAECSTFAEVLELSSVTSR